MAERGISMRDMLLMWTWHFDEVHAGEVWGWSYDIHGIYGFEVGYWENGTLWRIFFRSSSFSTSPFKPHSFYSSEHCSNVYYVLSEHDYLLAYLCNNNFSFHLFLHESIKCTLAKWDCLSVLYRAIKNQKKPCMYRQQ